MRYQLLLTVCLQVMLSSSAPLFLMPIPWMVQSPQQLVLQKQLMDMQALQHLSAHLSPALMSNQPQVPQPLVFVMPTQEVLSDKNTNDILKNHNVNDYKSPPHTNHENEDDLNSIVIEAASETPEIQDQVLYQPRRTILLLPNGRLSIGEIVSAIPWLPIEINVPDTISWAYNGIANGIGSIISIIGRPFQGSPQETQTQEAGLKALLKQIQTNKQNNMLRPIIMMPIDGPVLPIQV